MTYSGEDPTQLQADDDEPGKDAAETAIDNSKDDNLTWEGASHSHAFRRWEHHDSDRSRRRQVGR